MAIAFRAAGAGAVDATAPFSQVVAFPAGLVAGDICILVGTTDTAAGGTMSISNNGSISSWTAFTGTPVTVTAGEKLYLWWGRYVSGSTGPTLDASADHMTGAIVAYSGCVPNGSPVDVAGPGSETTSDTSFSFATGLTTGENNTMCVVFCTSGFDSVTNQFASAFTNANLVSCTRRAVTNQNTSVGGGGGFGVADGILTTAGAMGTFATTLLNATPKAYFAFSLRPDTSVNVSADVGSLTLAGFAPTIQTPRDIAAGVGALSLAGFAPTIQLPKNILAGVGSLTLTGFAPTVNVVVNQNPGKGDLILTGFAPTIQLPKNINPDKGDLLLAGFAPTIELPKNINAGKGDLILVGFAPTVELPVVVNPDVGQLVVTGFEPTVFASDNKEVLPGTGQLSLDGFSPDVQIPVKINPETGQLVVNGFEPTINVAFNAFTEKGDLILTGFAPFVFATKSFYDFICQDEKVISDSLQESETVIADYNCSENNVIIESK